MNSLRTLHEAFDVLEQRADTAGASDGEHAVEPRTARRSSRLLAPLAAATAVLLAAGGVAVWQTSSSHGSGNKAAGQRATTPVVHPSIAAAGAASATDAPARYEPPSTAAQLTARTRSILAGVATIVVTDSSDQGAAILQIPPSNTADSRIPAGPGVPLSGDSAAPTGFSGASIIGTLTAAGITGGFDLDVFATPPPFKALCDGDTDCTVTRLPNGTSLAVGTWHDPSVPGGVTYQVEAVRPDGADILLHLSTERDPKGRSRVTAGHLPLTVQQMIDFVASDRW